MVVSSYLHHQYPMFALILGSSELRIHSIVSSLVLSRMEQS